MPHWLEVFLNNVSQFGSWHLCGKVLVNKTKNAFSVQGCAKFRTAWQLQGNWLHHKNKKNGMYQWQRQEKKPLSWGCYDIADTGWKDKCVSGLTFKSCYKVRKTFNELLIKYDKKLWLPNSRWNTMHELVQSIKQNLKLSKFGLWFILIVIYHKQSPFK